MRNYDNSVAIAMTSGMMQHILGQVAKSQTQDYNNNGWCSLLSGLSSYVNTFNTENTLAILVRNQNLMFYGDESIPIKY